MGIALILYVSTNVTKIQHLLVLQTSVSMGVMNAPLNWAPWLRNKCILLHNFLLTIGFMYFPLISPILRLHESVHSYIQALKGPSTRSTNKPAKVETMLGQCFLLLNMDLPKNRTLITDLVRDMELQCGKCRLQWFFVAQPIIGTKIQEISTFVASFFLMSLTSPPTLWKYPTELLECPYKCAKDLFHPGVN